MEGIFSLYFFLYYAKIEAVKIDKFGTKMGRLMMDEKTLKWILEVGETIAVEFKRCGNGIENDVYETVCSFLNRFGGDVLWVC